MNTTGHPHAGARNIRRSNTAIGLLNTEWDRLLDDPAADAAVLVWGSAGGPLRGLQTMRELTTRLSTTTDHATIDAQLHTLLSLAQTGPHAELAARVVLQRMLPKAILLAVSMRNAAQSTADRFAGGTRTRAEDFLVAGVSCMFTVIKNYPLNRTNAVAANIAMDSLKAMRRSRLAEERQAVGLPADDTFRDPDEAITASEHLTGLLVWAVANGHLDRDTAELLSERYSGATATRIPTYFETLAASRGVTAVALRQRCSRAIRHLRTCAGDYAPVEELMAIAS